MKNLDAIGTAKGPEKVAKILMEKAYEGMVEGTPLPHLIVISDESKLEKGMVASGPTKDPKDGANIYLTVDLQRLRFDAKTGALLD